MPEITNPDVKLAFDTIVNKKPLYDELYKYYTGFHPLRYSTAKLREVFQTINVFFSENWLSVVVDAVIDRLVLKGFDISQNAEAQTAIDDLIRDHNILVASEDVHESATIVGEGFIIAMKVEGDDGEELDIYYNDPRMCHMFYEKDQPNKKRFAAKLWQDDERYTRLDLFYKDRFEHYISNKQTKTGELIGNAKNFIPLADNPEEDNPFSAIPVFHWMTSRTTKKRDMGPSEVSMQDAINKLLSDMMVSSEFNTYTQRVILSRADPGNMPNEPNANWWIPQPVDGNASQVIELGGKTLDGFLTAIDKLATALAIISRTPKHYFFMQGGDPSGEALIALEAPLNKKVKKRQGRYGVEWQAFGQFLLELQGITIKRNQIVPQWEPAETVQPLTASTITKNDTDAGMPLKTSKRRQGWSTNEIKQLEDDLAENEKKQSGLAQDALNKLRAEDARNNTMPQNGAPANAQNNGGTNTQVPPRNRS